MVELAWFLAGAGTVALVEFIILFASSVGDEQIDEDFLDNSSNNKKWHNKDRLVEKRGTPVATVSPKVVKTKRVTKTRKKRKIPVRKG